MSTSTFCTGCGAQLPGGRFCPSCGADTRGRQGTSDGELKATPARAGAQRSSADTAVKSRTADEPTRQRVTGGAARVQRQSQSAGQPDRIGRSTIPWLAVAACVGVIVVIIGAGAAILMAVGGKPATHSARGRVGSGELTKVLLSSRVLYTPMQQGSYSALLPAGWTRGAGADANFTQAVAATSPVDRGAQITVGALQRPARTLEREAQKLVAAASSRPSFGRQASGHTTLPGGRQAWAVAYTATGRSSAYYIIRSCGRMYGVGATLPAASVALLRSRVMLVAATLEGNC
jgi:hypothetical protein